MARDSFIINKSYDPLILRTILKRYWWWPVLFIAILTVFGFIYLRYTKPIYESQLMLQLSTKDSAKEVLDVENINSRNNDMSIIVELMRSELLFERAIGSLNLNVSLYSKGKVLTEEKYHSSSFNVQPYELVDSSLINSKIGVDFDGKLVRLSYEKNGKSVKLSGKLNEHLKNNDFDIVIKSSNKDIFRSASRQNELYFIFNSSKSLSSRLISGLNVHPVDMNAKTISISFRGHNPQLCHDVTLSVAKAFDYYDEQNERRGSENVLAFINTQLDSLQNELKTSKDSLVDFQKRSNLTSPDGAEGDFIGGISRLQEQLFEVEDDMAALNLISRKLKGAPNRLEVYRLLPEIMGKSYEGVLAGHISELHGLLELKDDLLYEVTADHPRVIATNQKIDSKIAMIHRSIKAINSRYKENVKVLSDKIASIESDKFDLPEKKMEYNRLKKIQDLNEKYFTLLTEKKALYAISDAGYSSSNRILKQPTVSMTPVAPSQNFIYGSFIFLGFILGLGVMFLKYLTFNEINLIEDLKNILPEKATILGGVPLFKYNMEYSQLVVSEAPKSMLAEAMRNLRTNLSYINPDYRTIAISSSISGEGKTFVALNLGAIIAMSGKKTILLDLDLRKPKIHLGFDVPNEDGMSSLIVGQSKLEKCIKKSRLENFDFITAGPIPPNPSELLLSQNFKNIIAELKNVYDVVIIDNPPVGLVSDGVKNLTDADIPIYVFKSHYSKRNFAYRIKELFEMQRLKNLNVILNGVHIGKGSVYGYGSGYGYGDDNGYIEDDLGKFNDSRKDQKWYRSLFKR